MFPKRYPFPQTHPEYWGDLHAWGAERYWELSSQSLELIKGTWIDRTTTYELLVTSYLQMSTNSPWSCPMLCTPHPPSLWPAPCAWVASVSLCRQLVCTCRKSAWLLDWKKAHKFEHFRVLPSNWKQTGGSQYLVWLYRIERRHAILRIPSQEETRTVEWVNS